MGEIFGFKFHLNSIIINPTKIFFEIPPCEKNVIFITEFVFLDLNPNFH